MAGIFKSTGAWSMSFDMDPAASSIFNISGMQNGSGSTSQLPFAFGYSWALNNTAGISLGTNLTTLVQGIRFYANGAFPSSSGILLGWYDLTAGAYQVTLRWFPDGHLQFYLGSGTGTPLGPPSAAGVLPGTTWTYIETKVIINASTGMVECRINGNATAIISATGLNTVSTANVWVSGFVMNSNFYGSTNSYWDDWYMLDTTAASPLNTYLGAVQVKGDKATANSAVGGRNAFTPTNPTNSNYQNVANVPFNSAEYNFDDNPGDYDMFRFGSLSAQTVYFLNEWAVEELDAAGPRTVALDCYSNGTDAQGAAFTPSAGTPTLYNQAFIVDPHTGLAWTVANAAAAELGVQVVT